LEADDYWCPRGSGEGLRLTAGLRQRGPLLFVQPSQIDTGNFGHKPQ
jgi:hypothetical protein